MIEQAMRAERENGKQAVILIGHGSRAAAAAKAAALLLSEGKTVERVEIPFPDGARISLPLVYAKPGSDGAEAAVRKDAGDALAAAVQKGVVERSGGSFTAAVVLIDLGGRILGSSGDLDPWL